MVPNQGLAFCAPKSPDLVRLHAASAAHVISINVIHLDYRSKVTEIGATPGIAVFESVEGDPMLRYEYREPAAIVVR